MRDPVFVILNDYTNVLFTFFAFICNNVCTWEYPSISMMHYHRFLSMDVHISFEFLFHNGWLINLNYWMWLCCRIEASIQFVGRVTFSQWGIWHIVRRIINKIFQLIHCVLARSSHTSKIIWSLLRLRRINEIRSVWTAFWKIEVHLIYLLYSMR